MINFRYGTSYSLVQSNIVVPLDPAQAVVAGMVVHPSSSTGLLQTGTSATDLTGFAMGNQTDTDVIASGNIGVLLLDGNSVIETDQVVETINSSNYPEGTKVYAHATNGKVTTTVGSNKQVGVAVGTRVIPGVETSIVNATTGVAQTVQAPVTVLQIKLLGA